MELFQKLGAEVEDAWRVQNYNQDLFPALAAEALARAGLPSKLSAWDVIKWALAEMGVIQNVLRLPLTPLSAPHHEAVRSALQDAGCLH